MYLLNVSYTQAPEKVAVHAPSHMEWLKKHFEAGHFLFAGPKKSGLGGIIAARSMDKAALQSLLAEDSFVRADVAEYQIADIDCRVADPQFDALKGV